MDRYPIVIDGEKKGEVRVWQEGLRTIFEAACADAGRMIRLWIFGEEGASAYLGVMAPRNGRLYLRRALTRQELRIFPKRFVHAGEKEAQSAENPPERMPERNSVPALTWEPLPNPWSLFGDTYTKTLLLHYRGALISRSEEGVLLALPKRGAVPELRGGQLLDEREIGGRICAVYLLKNLLNMGY